MQIKLSVLLLAFLCAGCDAQPDAPMDSQDGAYADKLFINAPFSSDYRRALDPEDIRVRVQIDNQETPTTRAGSTWTAAIQIDPNSPYLLTIEWTDSNGLVLARYEEQQAAITTDSSLSITSDQYDSASFDEDSDGLSNLEEISNGTDPYVPDGPVIPPEVRVSLPRIQASEAPEIDGLYDRDIWDRAQFRDLDGNRLSIDNLLSAVDTNTPRTDGNTEFEWAGMHDGTHLYLFVFGENGSAQGADARADSSLLYHDDSVELFFDGNSSRGTRYDGVDDTSIIIALLDEDGNTSGRISRGANDSQPIPDGLRYFNCLCTPVYTWEIAIPLASLNIDAERSFGMEIQINDDNNGGNRDSYWGWFQTRQSPATFFEPRIMGTIELR